MILIPEADYQLQPFQSTLHKIKASIERKANPLQPIDSSIFDPTLLRGHDSPAQAAYIMDYTQSVQHGFIYISLNLTVCKTSNAQDQYCVTVANIFVTYHYYLLYSYYLLADVYSSTISMIYQHKSIQYDRL